MKRLISILLFACLLLSCAPSRHAIHVEMRHPSKSGVDLTGKIVSVVYYSGDDAEENTASENIATGFAESLEKDYATGQGSVVVYSVERKSGDYAAKDSLVNLVIRTNGDVVFLLDAGLEDKKTAGGTSVKVNLYCYDGLDKSDSVKKFTGNTVLTAEEELGKSAQGVGNHLAESFKVQWKHEQYSIAYYDSMKWYEALARAEQYDWKGAMDIWFEFLGSADVMKRASAEYNIAVACYMLGDMDLADAWLKRSVADNDMPTLTEALRKRIDIRKAAM